MAALTIGFVSASVFIGHTPFSIGPGLVHLKWSFSFFQRMNFDGQGITDPGSTTMHGATRKPGLAIQRLGSRLHKCQDGWEWPVGLYSLSGIRRTRSTTGCPRNRRGA